jgi:hypothetical protein
VKEAALAREPEPNTHRIESKLTGMANAARKMPVTAALQSQPRKEGRKTREM